MIVTVAFGKGGTAKTSTAAAMVNYARMHGRSVLAIDSDPQANFTFALKGNAAGHGLYDVLTGGMDAADVIQETGAVDCGRSEPGNGRNGDCRQARTGLYHEKGTGTPGEQL